MKRFLSEPHSEHLSLQTFDTKLYSLFKHFNLITPSWTNIFISIHIIFAWRRIFCVIFDRNKAIFDAFKVSRWLKLDSYTVLYLNYTGCPKKSRYMLKCFKRGSSDYYAWRYLPMTMRIAARFPAFFVVADLDLTVELLFCLLLTKKT